MRAPIPKSAAWSLLALLATGCPESVPGPSRPPTARAGDDQTVAVGADADFDGRASTDPDDDDLTFHWRVIAAPDQGTVQLQEPEPGRAVLKPDRIGVWVVRLTVDDGKHESAPDVVQVVAMESVACVDDGDCDDEEGCTDDSCEAGSCRFVDKEDGTACEDDRYCTVNQTCRFGHCLGTDRRDCDDGDPCTHDTCDEIQDSCEHRTRLNPGAEGVNVSGTCTDTLDNDCDGQTDADDPDCETCDTNEDCDDDNPCTINTCQADNTCQTTFVANETSCNDDVYCTSPDTCTDGLCGGPPRDCSASANACNDGECDEEDEQCRAQPKPDGTACAPGSCNGLDWTRQTCLDGACSESTTNSCVDSRACTQDSCVPATGCVHTSLGAGADCGTCRVCTASDDCVDALGEHNECGFCMQCAAGGTCVNQLNTDIKDDCDNLLWCDGAEICNGSNQCQDGPVPCPGQSCDEVDDECTAGCVTDADCPDGLCYPSCTTDPSGCVTPPDSMTLDCSSPVVLSTSDVSSCTISLTGGDVDGQQDCLTCTASVMPTILDFTDFEDVDRNCSPDGWNLVSSSGDQCSGSISNCTIGSWRSCVSQFSSICDDSTFNNPVLRSDQNTNSGGDESFRLWKTFDASGLTGLVVCFDYAEGNADSDEALLVTASDSSHPNEPAVFCKHDGPVGGIDGRFYRFCVDLPPWADASPDLRIEFLMHSEDGGERLFLDNIEIFGWGGICAGTPVTVFQDDFTGCDWGQWTVAGSPICPGTPACNGDSLEVEGPTSDGGATWTIERTGIDASALDDRVTLCFALGSDDTGWPEDSVLVQYEAGDGWKGAFYQDRYFGSFDACYPICLDLSARDPDVNNNPDLSLRFILSSGRSGHEIVLDTVELAGVQFCPADPSEVGLSSPPQDGGSGEYGFTATDAYGTQLSTWITCSWDPDDSIEASTWVDYVP